MINDSVIDVGVHHCVLFYAWAQQIVLSCIRKQAEPLMETEQVNMLPPWPLIQLLPWCSCFWLPSVMGWLGCVNLLLDMVFIRWVWMWTHYSWETELDRPVSVFRWETYRVKKTSPTGSWKAWKTSLHWESPARPEFIKCHVRKELREWEVGKKSWVGAASYSAPNRTSGRFCHQDPPRNGDRCWCSGESRKECLGRQRWAGESFPKTLQAHPWQQPRSGICQLKEYRAGYDNDKWPSTVPSLAPHTPTPGRNNSSWVLR